MTDDSTATATDPLDVAEHATSRGYKVVCISLYDADLARVDEMVFELKRRGLRKANRSWVIRCGLAWTSVDEIATRMSAVPR